MKGEWNGLTSGFDIFQVELDGFTEKLKSFLTRSTYCNTAR